MAARREKIDREREGDGETEREMSEWWFLPTFNFIDRINTCTGDIVISWS